MKIKRTIDLFKLNRIQLIHRINTLELEKENKEYASLICKFDKEVNRLFNIIKDASKYIDETLLTENGSILDLKNILYKAKEVSDAKTISQ